MQASKLKKLLGLVLLGGLLANAGAQGLRMPGEQPSSTLRSSPAPAASAPAPAPVPAPAPTAQPARPAAAAPQQAPALAAPAPGQASQQFGDSIVAVVNNDVITRRELDQRVQAARATLAEQNIPAPDVAILERQVLERLISDVAQLQEADRAGIRVSDAQLDTTIRRIAEQNNVTIEQMREQIQREGMTWDEYRADLRDQIRLNRLREEQVDRNIIISEAEIDAFLAEQAVQRSAQPGQAQAAGVMLHIAQILVRVPEGSSPDQIAALRARAEQILQQARSGADFAQLAAANSDGEEALRGGDLGVRPAVGWPDLFLSAVGRLQPGQVSDIVQSGNGFHILKVLAREGGAAPGAGPLGALDGTPQEVVQHHVRHILVRPSAVVSDEQARIQLQALRDRVTLGGASFADLARQYSEDASAPQGGDIGWVSPGETVPDFERAVTELQPGQVSQPIRTEFGWHLILVEERRVQDVTEQSRRMQARQILFQRKLEPAWAEWVSMVRSRAYVDNRLERGSEL